MVYDLVNSLIAGSILRRYTIALIHKQAIGLTVSKDGLLCSGNAVEEWLFHNQDQKLSKYLPASVDDVFSLHKDC